jgi:2-methylisocitrate lyase-like PEP mutase family enzyme
MTESTTLRSLLTRSAPVAMAGVGTALEATIAERAGCEVVYVSGYATAAWVFGQPDIGLIALGEMGENAARVVECVEIPVIVDIDTGYGDITQVRRAVRIMEQLGAAGIQIEDQQWPKRCGHMGGKSVIPAGDMIEKIRAAVMSRESDDTVIIARTDAREREGIDGAVARAQSYAQAGADVVFVDAPESLEEVARIGREVLGPKLLNMSETGKTPIMSVSAAGELGFQLILFPTSGVRVATMALGEVYRSIAAGDTTALLPRMSSLDELNAILGIDRLSEFEGAVQAGAA